MELQQHKPCFNNDKDSQQSYSHDGEYSDRSEHFVEQFFKTQNKVNDESDPALKKTNIIHDRVKQKMVARLEETRKLEQTMTSEGGQTEGSRPGTQMLMRIGKPTPMIPACLMTHGTDLTQTQESVKIPPLKLNQHLASVPIQPQDQKYVHQITIPQMNLPLLRQISNNELQNSLIDNSNLLDPDDFVMSNTSMSLHTQSQVLGADTSRGNLLKDSGLTLQEDSTMLQDSQNDHMVPMSQQNHEILNRQVTHENRPSFNSDMVTKNEIRQETGKDFIVCQDVVQVDEDMPHLNKTTSMVVNEQFRVKNIPAQQYNSIHAYADRFNNYKLSQEYFSGNTPSINKSETAHEKVQSQSVKGRNHHELGMKQVQDSMNRQNNWLSISKYEGMAVQAPEIMNTSQKKQNSSTANLMGLNRSVAETNLNQSVVSNAPKKQQTQPSSLSQLGDTSMSFNHNDGMNSITQKVDKHKFLGIKNERQLSLGNPHIQKYNNNKHCRQKKSVVSQSLIKDFQDNGRSEEKKKFKLLHQSQDNFHSQGRQVSSSMEFNKISTKINNRRASNNSTVVTLRSKNQATRRKSSFSSVHKPQSSHQQTGDKPLIPKTPLSSTKLKMISAKKQKSVSGLNQKSYTSNPLLEEGLMRGHTLNNKRRSNKITSSSVNAVNASMNFDSSTQNNTSCIKVTQELTGSRQSGLKKGEIEGAIINGCGSRGNILTTNSSHSRAVALTSGYQSNVTRSVGALQGGRHQQAQKAASNIPNGIQPSMSFMNVPTTFQQAEAQQRELKSKARYRNIKSTNEEFRLE